jgi:hypothetical protein
VRAAEQTGACARRPIGDGVAAGRGGSGSTARAAWEAQRPQLLLLPPSGSGGGGFVVASAAASGRWRC